jgi:GWxTD domain-containing protein
MVRIAALALGGIAPAASAAQRPLGSDTLSAAAVAESLKVLAHIRTQLEKDRNNAALWYHRGMLAWALYDRDRTTGGLKELDWKQLGREADSSIRLAVRTAPGNARYKITQGQYYLGTGWIPMRVQAYHVFNQALRDARRSGDSLLLSEALVEKARVHWRRYEPGSFGNIPANYRIEAFELRGDSARLSDLVGYDVDSVTTQSPSREALRTARAQMQEEMRYSDGGFRGEADYKHAEDYFREAYEAAPSFTRAYRQLAMLFADRHRWTELGSLARARIAQEPRDAWAFMTAGLAALRSGHTKAGRLALDSGFTLLSPGERARLDNIQRTIRPSDSLTVAGWTSQDRERYAERFWRWSAPLWSGDNPNAHAEFLARVTYAEMRWTVDELRSKRGADSDRGRVHIRYGPPDGRNGGRYGESWFYDIPQISFFFGGTPTFGTAYFGNPAYAMHVMDSLPSLWENMVRERIDTLPVRVTRFRATSDSVDIVFASQPPVAAIRRASSIDSPIRAEFWLLDQQLRELAHTSGVVKDSDAHAFVSRVPSGEFLYRFEATAEGSMRAGRAVSSIRAMDDAATAFRLRGFGMSDVLIARRLEPRGQTRRWTDFEFDPSAGAIPSGSELALLWENYDLTEKDGVASYEVVLTIERKRDKLTLDRLGARIVKSLSSLVRQEQTEDRIVYRYERTTAHAPVIADYFSLVLADLPGGEYDMSIALLDRNSGRMTSKTSRVVIRE